jgi:hypothetical protein
MNDEFNEVRRTRRAMNEIHRDFEEKTNRDLGN